MKLGQLIQLRRTSDDELSDRGLAAACAAGDRAAQTLLFERHVDDVYRFIARLRASDAAAIDDLVQATFIAAFDSAHRFHGPKLRSWLFGIAINVTRAYVRREIAHKRIAGTLAAEPLQVVTPRDAEIARIRAAIDQLSPKLREVVVLVDLEGERCIDVAATLGVPEGTVWRRLSDARAKLRELLGGTS